MSEYQSTLSLPQIAQRLLSAQHIGITTHAKPDGDAAGSLIALAHALRALGKDVKALLMPPVPAGISTVAGIDIADVTETPDWLTSRDLMVFVDTGSYQQTAPIAEQTRQMLDRVLVIDHHRSGDIESERYVDAESGACCEIIAQLVDLLLESNRGNVDAGTMHIINDALYLGVASDTGWFRFSNTRPQTHELAARLLRDGVDHTKLLRKGEQTERPEKLALMARMLSGMCWLANGRAAMLMARTQDFTETGTSGEDTERMVDLPQMVRGVDVVVMVSQPPEPNGNTPRVRVSFRSQPGPNAVDVAALANRFGGGGHQRAAGAKLEGDIDEIAKKVADAVEAAMKA